MDILAAIEHSGFSTWIRESPSVWAYPTVLFLHTIGIGFLVGTSMAVDLRILGFANGLPLSTLERFFPVMLFGFVTNALSGIILVMIDATTMLANPLFYIKIVLIALALGSGMLIRRSIFSDPLAEQHAISLNCKLLASASLLFWVAAVTAGRLTAYIFAHPELSASAH
jgi:hypothetical protein